MPDQFMRVIPALTAVAASALAVVAASSPDEPGAVRGGVPAFAHHCGKDGCLQTNEIAACLMPGTSIRMTAGVNQHMQDVWNQTHPDDQGGVAFFLGPRWPGMQGDPITIRWSIVPDGLNIPGSQSVGEPAGPSTLQQTLINVFGSVENGLQRFRLVFDRWSELSGITFLEVSDDGAAWGAPGPLTGGANRGDVRIGMHPFGFGGVLAYTGFPNGGDMVMNGSINWSQPQNNYRFLRNVLAHESGHGVGLRHSCPQIDTKLMEPLIALNFDGPQHDDIRGAQRHYGDTRENNNSAATATPLGGPFASMTVLNLSLDDDSDLDYFSFVASPNTIVSIFLTPTGSTYLNGPQNEDNSCSAGVSVNSLAVLDLRLRLLNTNGSTVLHLEDINPAGLPERILNFALPPAGGTFYILASGLGADDIQTYRLEVFQSAAPPPTCLGNLNGDTEVNGLDLGILLVNWSIPAGAPGCGGATPCASDLNGDTLVNGLDLGILLGNWGACP
jgi:hypothetical protein